MAQTVIAGITGVFDTQARISANGAFLAFADSIIPTFHTSEGGTENQLIITSNVEFDQTSPGSATDYEIVADDAMNELSVDIATGKFVEGNLIVGYAPLSEVKEDVRNYVAYKLSGSDTVLFKGICATTQSQDYTPGLVANSRAIWMATPAQVKSLNL